MHFPRNPQTELSVGTPSRSILDFPLSIPLLLLLINEKWWGEGNKKLLRGEGSRVAQQVKTQRGKREYEWSEIPSNCRRLPRDSLCKYRLTNPSTPSKTYTIPPFSQQISRHLCLKEAASPLFNYNLTAWNERGSFALLLLRDAQSGKKE